MPDAKGVRRQIVEHPLRPLESWIARAHFLSRIGEKTGTEMSIQVLADNMKKMIQFIDIAPLMEVIWASSPLGIRS